MQIYEFIQMPQIAFEKRKLMRIPPMRISSICISFAFIGIILTRISTPQSDLALKRGEPGKCQKLPQSKPPPRHPVIQKLKR